MRRCPAVQTRPAWRQAFLRRGLACWLGHRGSAAQVPGCGLLAIERQPLAATDYVTVFDFQIRQCNRFFAGLRFCTNSGRAGLIFHTVSFSIDENIVRNHGRLTRYLRRTNTLEFRVHCRPRGLWSERDPIPPWEYRHAGKKAN